MKKTKITVLNKNLNYSLFVGYNSINLLPKKIKLINSKSNKIGVVLDKKVPKKYKSKIKKLLKNYRVFFFEYSVSENLKSFSNVNGLLEKCIRLNFNRNDFLIAVGGGIVGDFCGFVASILKRGINFINIPTTLLAQVDSAVGGKTGVNSKQGKNLIGSYYQPNLVICDLSFLNSLPKRQVTNGYAEILKHAIISDKKFFNWLKKNSQKILEKKDAKCLTYAITKSNKIKLSFANKDVRDKNIRMTLNFGHTFAHAIESRHSYSKKINHGEAVLIGMMMATKLSFIKNVCNKATLLELIKIYQKNNLDYKLKGFLKKKEFNSMTKFMIQDKKNDDNKINLILLRKIGKTTRPGQYKLTLSELRKNNIKLNNLNF